MTRPKLRDARGGMSAGVLSGLLAGVLLLAAPAAALGHPLGNFTINHYAGLRISPRDVAVDVVLDFAEIPTFQERQRIDTDGDGTVSPAEAEAERSAACGRLAPSLTLTADGTPLRLSATAAGLGFQPGAAGLLTMRLVCEYVAPLATPLGSGAIVAFADASYAERIGWREVTAVGDGTTLATSAAAGYGLPPATSVSGRLTHYPADLLSQPLDVRSVSFAVSPGGAAAAPWSAPDAAPLAGAPSTVRDAVDAGAGATASAADPALARLAGAIPGGERIGDLLGGRDLSLPLVGLALAVAVVLGAAHAISPGHGKTVMAAYLVGSRGSARHAVALGLVVTVSHTLGVLGLAAVTMAASTLLPPERLYPVLGVASGSIVVAIGLWLVVGRWRAWTASRAHAHDDGHGHDSADDRAAAHAHEHAHEHRHEHRHEPAQEREAPHMPVVVAEAGAHRHGLGPAHRHAPAYGSRLTWRGLFSLGLAGGLVPSASALLLLLGSLSAGRPALGLLLVVGFGAGMAVVLSGVGLALVYASRLVERLPATPTLGRLAGLVPTATAVAVLALGLVLTGGALHQVL